MIFNTGSGGNATRIVTGKSLYLNDTAGGKYKNIKLVGASVQNGTPAVSKPVDIVSNKVKSITAGSKNLLDCRGLTTQTESGITFTPVYKDGQLEYINVNGTNDKTADSNYQLAVFFGSGTFLMNGASSNVGKTTYKLATKIDGTWDGTKYQDTMEDVQITVENSLIVTINVLKGATLTNEKIYPMLRLASDTDATYVPFTGINTAELDETYELNAIDGIYDEIDLERGVRVQRFGVDTYNGLESWITSSYVIGRQGTNTKEKAKAQGKCMCTMAVNYTNDLVGYCHINQAGSFYINTSYETVAEWKAHLQANPLTVVYELETPIETPLSVDELIAFKNLRAYQSGSTLVNDGNCDMEVEYFLNNKVGQPMADIHMNTAKYILDGATLNIIV